MLGVRIENQFIDLFASTAINFELNSPIFLTDNTDIFPGSYSFPFSVPANSHNRKILGAAEAIDNADPFLSKAGAEIYVFGALLFVATAYIKEATPDVFKLFLVVKSLEDLKERPLNQISLGGDRFIGPNSTAHAKLTAQNPEDYDYTFFPVYNDSFWGADEDPGGFLSHIQNPYDSFNDVFRESSDALSAMPFVKLEYLLQQMFGDEQLGIQNDFQTTTELKRLYLYNNYSIYTDSGDWDTTINLQNHVSATESSEFIKGLAKNFCLGFFYSPFNKEVRVVPLRDLLLENYAFDWTSKASASYSVNIERNFPGIFCYRNSVDQKESTLLEYPVDILAEVDTLGDAVSAGGPGIYYIRNTNSYRYIPNPSFPPDGYIYNKKTLICKDTGYNDQLLESQVGTMYMDDVIANYGTDVVPLFRYNPSPIVQIRGTHPPRNQKNEMPDKLIFYRGFQLNDFFEFYPMASNNLYAQNDLPLVGYEYTLLWDKDPGLYRQWWQNWHQMLQNQKEVSRTLQLTVKDLINFSFDKKVRIENMDFFVRQLTISITSAGLAPTQAQLVSVA